MRAPFVLPRAAFVVSMANDSTAVAFDEGRHEPCVYCMRAALLNSRDSCPCTARTDSLPINSMPKWSVVPGGRREGRGEEAGGRDGGQREKGWGRERDKKKS